MLLPLAKVLLNCIVQGDCLTVMREWPSDSVDCIVTDPPYGLEFMGKDWDRAVPGVDVWRECLRVLKAGAFAFIMCTPRQDCLSRMIVNLQDAGFNTGFTSIYWTYASGFPKAMNISKAVDKRLGLEREIIKETPSGGFKRAMTVNVEQGFRPKDYYPEGNKFTSNEPISEQAKALDGSYGGFQPKPAVEVILVVMKPLSEKTYVDQALKNGKGCTWLDDARIPTREDNQDRGEKHKVNTYGAISVPPKKDAYLKDLGRFPANLLCEDDILNDGRTTNSRIDKRNEPSNTGESGIYNDGWMRKPNFCNDSGSFSRYFDLDKWAQRTYPFLICPKASKSERNQGCETLPLKIGGGMKGTEDKSLLTGSGNIRNNQMKNNHPTVKPLKLMSYLVTLGSRPNDVVLDPFAGSGTTCLAAKLLGRLWIGVELNPEYCKIAEKRLGLDQPTLDMVNGK